jgi:hypothetical protein
MDHQPSCRKSQSGKQAGAAVSNIRLVHHPNRIFLQVAAGATANGNKEKA